MDAVMQNQSVIQVIEDLERQRYAAMVAGDLEALGALLDDELIYIHSTALVDDKASYLALIQDGYLVYKDYNPVSVRIRPTGEDVVVLSGHMKMNIVWAGKPKALDNVYIASWVRRPGAGWRFLTWQSTAVPPATLAA
jgi:hypothetical protein